ncbi:hypothetical protein Aple_001500 [Acrocarpospora pleiomorpha]|uniref:VOC domain-containing protein n=1 Tax=Acrocarpospora pleiomorpha TaxID=90975 RepID=A0A5M3X6E0_9ACTN|nr:VOC family protein [Acrocarpospora pleiomorpha]GES17255.1 hypothetical protein Aple_001500 [Acrocarpospora pleiomorpha]
MLTCVDHIDIRTPDLDGAVDFFARLGFAEVRRTDPERGSVELALPGPDQVVLEIRLERDARRTYVHHVAFRVDDHPAAVEQLTGRGVEFSKNLAFIHHTGRTISNAHDPGGATWQLTD